MLQSDNHIILHKLILSVFISTLVMFINTWSLQNCIYVIPVFCFRHLPNKRYCFNKYQYFEQSGKTRSVKDLTHSWYKSSTGYMCTHKDIPQ